MGAEIISRKTRNEFREFLVHWTLRQIEMEFEAAGICRDRDYAPQCPGQRRSVVEQYYHTLDFTRPTDIRRLLAAFENILNSAVSKSESESDRARIESAMAGLIACLRRDGFRYEDGRLIPISPEAKAALEEGNPGSSISEITRLDIIDALRIHKVRWSGRLSESDFLSCLYDLDSLPSHDHRFKSARGDIWQHRELNPDDWPDDWVFTDSRFDLVHSSDETFLRFLCEIIHLVVRPDMQEVESLIGLFNQHLASDGWEIAARTRVSGKPVFAARRRLVDSSPALEGMRPVIGALNTEYVSQQITRMETSITSDPELAIGTAKDFVETICKTILHECGETVSDSADLPQLVRQVRERLDLVPDDIPERAKGSETIKRILRNLATVAQGLAEIRGLYGSGHGRHARSKGLKPRHARLAVGAASTLSVFLFETYQERRERADQESQRNTNAASCRI